MNCVECGNEIEEKNEKCLRCGALHDVKAVSLNQEQPVGTKWMKFWLYTLPLGAVISVLGAVAFFKKVPFLSIIMICWAALDLILFYGLYKKTLWGWKLNWVNIALMFIVYVMPGPGYEALSAGHFGRITAASLWIWANYIYWKKRRFLFVNV